MSMNVIEASGLGKRYGGTWALRECSLAIPAGHVAALVGPNGAGKTTLLNLAVGLAAPSAGGVTVLGGLPAGSPEGLDGIAFVAQDTPVYRNLSAADMLHLTRSLNRRFDQSYARARLNELGISLNRKAGRLSGGQQAQLALTLTLARRPRLLVLDEPVAMLDPVARHDFMATVLAAMADDGVSVGCWPGSWRRAPSGTPGPRAWAGGAGRSPSWGCSRSRWRLRPGRSACSSPGTTSRSSPQAT